MKLVVAIREQSTSKARDYLAGLGAETIKSRYETQDPALRNLVDGLVSRGLQLESDGVSLHWYLIASSRSAEHWLADESVAVCFAHAWLHQQAMAIRYLKGIAYCNAAAGWADFLPFDQEPAAQLANQGDIDWRGLPVVGVAAPAPGEQPGPAALDATMQVGESVAEVAPLAVAASGADRHVGADQSTQKMQAAKPSIANRLVTPDSVGKIPVQSDVRTAAQVKPVRKRVLKKSTDIAGATDAKNTAPAIVSEPVVKTAVKPARKTRPRKRPVREQEEQLDLFG